MDPIIMTPDPLYMTLRNMRQSAHGDRAFAGNLGGHEFVVSKVGVQGYEDYPSVYINADDEDDALHELRKRALEDAQKYADDPQSGCQIGDHLTLIEIRVVGHVYPKRESQITTLSTMRETATTE
jgi:hypothetical protein